MRLIKMELGLPIKDEYLMCYYFQIKLDKSKKLLQIKVQP